MWPPRPDRIRVGTLGCKYRYDATGVVACNCVKGPYSTLRRVPERLIGDGSYYKKQFYENE